MLSIKDKSVQPIVAVLTDEEMANNAVAAYSPIQNVVYVRQALLDYDKLPTIQKQLACPNSKYSTLLHEYIHWFDAQRYRTKHGDFNNADDYGRYIARLRRNCKKKLDKLGVNEYNISSMGRYAERSYEKDLYDEAYTEYRVVKILRK